MALEQVGVEEIYVHVEDKAVMDTFHTVKKNIQDHHIEKKKEKLIHPALSLFSSDRYLDEFFMDIKLYMEACVVCSDSDAEAFLITDDHRFFRFFLRSNVIEEFLRSGVNKVLGQRGIPIKLAGEVIPGV